MSGRARADLEPLWLAAANERLAQQRERIPVLGRLADELGIDRDPQRSTTSSRCSSRTRTTSRIPTAFIAKGRWDLMNQWLDTLSSMRVDDVDVEGVDDQDEWIERLHAAGHMVFVTSGTSGKNSFLPADAVRRGLLAEDADPMIHVSASRSFADGQRRPIFILGPKYGHHRVALYFRTSPRRSDVPTPASSSPRSRCGSRRSAAWATSGSASPTGTAMPSEIAAFERETATHQAGERPSGSTSSSTRCSSTATSR